MKGIVVTPADEIYVKDFQGNPYEAMEKHFGWIPQKVTAIGLPDPYVFFCHEAGLLMYPPLGFNRFGSLIYSGEIVGDIIIMKYDGTKGPNSGPVDFDREELNDIYLNLLDFELKPVSNSKLKERNNQ